MKRFLKIWATLAIAIVLAWGASYFAPVASAAAKPERISLAYCADCVQFHFQNKDGKADGLIIDMWRLWSERTGIAIDYKPATWEETLKMVGEGRADAHAGLFFNEERAKFLEYGTSLTETDTQFFVHKDLPGIEKVEDLTAYKVGVLSGDYVEGYLKKKLPPENIVGFESYEAIMEALGEGRLQVFAADTPTGIFHLQKAGLGYVFEAPASKPLYTQKWFVAATKGNTELIKIINAGMALVTKSERREIERRWASISDPVVFDAEKTDKRLNLTVQERQWLADHPVIRVHNETDWPPFNFFDDAKPQGFSIDYMNLLASMIGVKVEYVTGPTWNEFLSMMKGGDLDVMLNIVKTPERQKYLLYTKPYAFNPNTILSRRETIYESLEQLAGKTVALPKGFFYEEILKRDYPRIKMHLAKNVTESMKAVAFGKADAAFGELAVFNYLLGREMMTGLVLSGEVKLGGVNYTQLNIATRKDLPVLISILSKAMNVVSPDEVKVLRQRWINIPTAKVPKTKKINLTDEEKAWLAEHKTMRLGVDQLYPPFEFLDENGTYSGMASDYVRLVSERLGITMEVVPGLLWDEVLDGVKKHTIDILPAAAVSPERKSFVNFSNPHMVFPVVIVTRDDYPFVAGLNDLTGKTVAQTKGYAVTKHIEAFYPEITRLQVDNPLQALRAVSAGEAKAAALNLAVATYLIKKHNLANLKVAAPVDIDVSGLAFAVRKDWPELVGILNKTLASITPEEKNAIRSKWVSVQYQPGIDIMLALQIGGAGGVIIILIVLWNRRLSREVSQRKQAEEELRNQNRFIELLHKISEASNAAVTVDDAFKVCLDEICADTGWPVGHVYVHHPGQEFPLESSKVWHLAKPRKFTFFRKITEATGFRLGEGLPGRVLESRKAAWIRDVTEDENFPRAKQAKDIGVRGGFAFPVSLGDQVLAVFEFFSEQAEDLDQRTLDILTNVGRQLGGVIARKHAETTLSENEERFRDFSEAASDWFWEMDENLRFTYFSDRFTEISGVANKDLIGKTRQDSGLDMKDDTIRRNIADLEGHRPFKDFEHSRTLANGDVVYLSTMGKPVFDADGNFKGYRGTGRDITERKRAEEVLQEAHEIIKDQKERMEDELNIGREIQMSMVPLVFPPFPDHNEFSVFATLEPAREVGGDFYDFYFIDEERLCLCIGDVSGKGVPSALFMAMAKTLIKSRAAEDASTASILTHVNDELSADNKTCMFVTIFAGILNIRTGELVYTNAGHNPPYLRRNNGAAERLDQRHGPVIGAVEGMVYKEETVTMEPGDLLFLYSDGITEARDAGDRLFSEDRLKELLTSMGADNAQTAVENMVAAVRAFEGEAEQADDITVLGLEFHGSSEDAPMAEERIVIKNHLPEIAAVNEKFEAFSEEFGVPAPISTKFNIIFDELLNNVISYAYTDDDEHDIEVRIELAGERLTVTITDDGVPFNPLNVESPDTGLPLEDRKSRGLGIHLVRNLIDDVSYQRRIDKNVMTMVKHL